MQLAHRPRIVGLTLSQPWASLMALGVKRVESRSWPTQYTGLVAIHASKTMPRFAKDLCWSEPFRSALVNCGVIDVAYADADPTRRGVLDLFSRFTRFPLGAIVAVGDLVHVVRTDNLQPGANAALAREIDKERVFGDYTPGRFAWVFANVRKLPEPVPCAGQRMLWPLRDEIAERVFAQLAEVARA